MTYIAGMKRNSIRKSKVVLSISDASISPQLIEIIESLKSDGMTLYIFISASDRAPLLASIKALEVSYRVLSPVSKFGLIRHLLIIVYYLLRNRPTTFIASGQYATFSGMPAAYILRIKNRIYIRHHSNYHHNKWGSFRS